MYKYPNKLWFFCYCSEFKNNPELSEIPFTSYKLTVGEIACMLEEAENLGLNAVEVGSVSKYHNTV